MYTFVRMNLKRCVDCLVLLLLWHGCVVLCFEGLYLRMEGARSEMMLARSAEKIFRLGKIAVGFFVLPH